jgi:hypothetical protein
MRLGDSGARGSALGRSSGAGSPRTLQRGVRRAAGKRATRFRAASSVRVIRVDLTPTPAHQCAWRVSPTRIPTRRGTRASRASERRPFSRLAEADRGRPVPVLRITRALGARRSGERLRPRRASAASRAASSDRHTWPRMCSTSRGSDHDRADGPTSRPARARFCDRGSRIVIAGVRAHSAGTRPTP